MDQQPRMGSTAEARQAESRDRIPHGLYDSWDWNDHAADDDEVYLPAVEGFLSRKSGEPQKPIAQVFRLGNATHENIGNDSRFDQNNAHLVESPATNPPSKQAPELPATARRLSSTRRVNHGEFSVKGQS